MTVGPPGGGTFFEDQPSTTALQVINFNGAVATTTDITPMILPYHMGLLLTWVSEAGSNDFFINATVHGTVGPVDFLGQSTINSGGSVVVAIPGQYPVATGGLIQIILQPRPSAFTPVVGQLFVYALTAPPLINVEQRWLTIGVLNGVVATIAASSTAALVPAAPAGYYNRVKSLSYNHIAAGAAVSRVSFIDNGSGQALDTFVDLAAANQRQGQSYDLLNVNGILLNNGASVAVQGVAAYELWPI